MAVASIGNVYIVILALQLFSGDIPTSGGGGGVVKLTREWFALDRVEGGWNHTREDKQTNRRSEVKYSYFSSQNRAAFRLITEKDITGFAPVHYAAKHGHLQVIVFEVFEILESLSNHNGDAKDMAPEKT